MDPVKDLLKDPVKDLLMDPERTPRLACFGGHPAPPEMAEDLRRLAALPEPAQRRLWEALGPSLPDPIPAGIEQRLTDFCRRFELDDGHLARALKACRHLVRAASAADLDRARFADDIACLAGESDAPRIQSILLAGYDAARTLLRAELAAKTLAVHDDLVKSIDYRVEQIVASSHGENLNLRVLALSFQLERGGRDERVTVHLAPEQIEQLLRACERAIR